LGAKEAEAETETKAMTKRFVDISHPVTHGMITYKGLPAPIICDYMSREASRGRYAPGTEFHIGRIDMVANTGTYVDAPFHRFPDGKDLADLPLSSLADLPAVVIRATTSGERAIGPGAFAGQDLQGKAVIVHTGWSAHFGTDQYFEGHPFLTEDAARYLASAGAALVGIDSLNIDAIDDGRRPVHTTLLAAEIPIAEHLTNLADLPDQGSRLFAVPVKVRRFGTFPVRAFGLIE
jgi:kynurenine formamidase